MTLRHLRIFIAVCDTGSITAAGQALYIAQPSVSVAISELESYYGIKLFDRIARRLHITQAGRQFLEYARHIISTFDEMEHSVQAFTGGTLKVGATPTPGACLMSALAARFEAQNPLLRLQVVVDRARKLEEKVLSGELDMAIVKGGVKSDRLIIKPFSQEKLMPVFAPGHPLDDGRESVSPEELARQKFLLREKGSGSRDLFDNAMAIFHLAVEPLWESTDNLSLLAAAEAGMGVAVLHESLCRPLLEAGRLKTLRVEGVDLCRPYLLIRHENKYLSPAAQAFVDACLQE
ncbi:MAG: LysR family transcriptional regulator [Christensenellaceae bacterium]|nr:LysR family transcriptional regulator [Christensenellaceae bacterium]